MIRVERLVKRYGGRAAVDGVSLAVEPGEVYALLGPNGAGKSTTLACLLGFVVPDAGRALVGAVDVAADPAAARRRLAYVPEQVSLYDDFTGVENLAYLAELAGRRLAPGELRALLAEVGLPPEAHGRRVGGYSKGMRQKVGLAIALAKGAEALLLDEPTSGLDPSASHEFSQALARLRAGGVAVLMATHDLFRAREDAVRIGILAGGRLVAEFAAADVGHDAIERRYLAEVRAAASATADAAALVALHPGLTPRAVPRA